MLVEQQYEVDLQFGFDVGALAPVGVFGFVIDHRFDLLGELDQFVLGAVNSCP